MSDEGIENKDAVKEPVVQPDGNSVTLKIDGTERTVTKDELIKMAEKAGGADMKFQKAAEMKKEAEKGLRALQLMQNVQQGGEDVSDTDLAELAGMMGIDPKELVDKGVAVPAAPAKTPGVSEALAEAFDEICNKKFGMPARDVADTLLLSRHGQVKDAEKMIESSAKEVVDKDEILGKIVSNDKEAGEALVDVVKEEVQKRIRDGETFGPELLGKAVQRARTLVKKFGISNGRAPNPIIGYGPSGQLPPEIYANEPIKRIASTEPGYADNVAKRFLQRFALGRK